MGTAAKRLDEIADIVFGGRVAKQVAAYAKATQTFAHDMARELDAAEAAAEAAMRELEGHPLLFGLDVKARAWWVARHLREARELVQGISAEAVKFNSQFRLEFLDNQQAAIESRPTAKSNYKGRVQL